MIETEHRDKKMVIFFNQHTHERTEEIVNEMKKILIKKPDLKKRIMFLNLSEQGYPSTEKLKRIASKKVEELFNGTERFKVTKLYPFMEKKLNEELGKIMNEMKPEFREGFKEINKMTKDIKENTCKRTEIGTSTLRKDLEIQLMAAYDMLNESRLVDLVEKMEKESNNKFEHIFNLHGTGFYDGPTNGRYIVVHEDHPHDKLYQDAAQETGFMISRYGALKIPFSLIPAVEFEYPKEKPSEGSRDSSKKQYQDHATVFLRFLERVLNDGKQ